tara:strand:- start:508 stop:1494 length:987 start_codon:yes stop_codon:yes gene_type:complete
MEFILENPEYLYAGAALLFCVFMYFAFMPDHGSDFDKRLKRVSHEGGAVAIAMAAKSAVDIRLKNKQSVWDGILKKIMPRPDMLKSRLERTGFKITIGTFSLLFLLVSVITVTILMNKTDLTLPVIMIIALPVGYKVISFVINFMIVRREKSFMKRFPDAIDLMVRGIKSGLPLSQTVQSIGQEIEGPVGEEFAKIADSIRLGTDLTDALWASANRLGISEMKFFCIALSIQQETGGNLAETLTNLSTILRKRKQVKLKIKAMSSEAKASAIIIGSLPFVMYLILKLLNPEYVEPLFGDPRGIRMAMVGFVMIGFGALVMNKLVKFEV